MVVDPDNCERQMLTFAAEHAPDGVFGLFVVPRNTSADVDCEFMAMVGGKWELVARKRLAAGTRPGGFKQWSLITPWPAFVGKLLSSVFWTIALLTLFFGKLANRSK